MNLLLPLSRKNQIGKYIKPHKGYVDGIALLDDIAKAKERWFGKTIYSKKRKIQTYEPLAETSICIRIIAAFAFFALI